MGNSQQEICCIASKTNRITRHRALGGRNLRKLICLVAAATAASAPAQLIVGNDQTGTATIYSVHVGTGVATPLYSASTATAKPWGMAADNVNNILYWNNGGNLYRATYAELLGGTAAPTPLAMTFNSTTVNYVSLGFNPNTGMLIGTRNIATEAVYEIDPVTGIGTQLYVYPSAFDFGGLDYDAATSTLFGLTDANTAGLYEIDTGAQSTTFRVGYPGGETDIDGLGVGGGNAYYVTDGPNTTQANFYVVDLGTNSITGTLPSPFTGSGTFSAGAWAPGLVVPEPGSFVALGIGLAVLTTLRRRK